MDTAPFIIDRVRPLTGSVYVVRFSRNEMQFIPGQYLLIGLPGSARMREYSIYSGTQDPYLEILIQEVDDGKMSKALKKIKPGKRLEVHGPEGKFLSEASRVAPGKLLFIASGTGIAPFHSFVRSYPQTEYRLLHGIRTRDEAYDLNAYRKEHMVLCTSRDQRGDFSGRVTDYLAANPPEPDQQAYLCGSSQMIRDAIKILNASGIPLENITTEVYY